MATSKTLTPTNQTILIPALSDQPDASVFADAIDKEGDAINALNSKFTKVTFNATSSDSIVDISSQISADKFVLSAVSSAGNLCCIPYLDNNGKWFLFLRGTASWQTLGDQSRSFTVVYMN